MFKRPYPVLSLFAASLLGLPAHASEPPKVAPSTPTALVDFSLEQLADVVVTSVSRQETRLADVPASIYLISGADIRRAGATSLPEALRLAPNLQVAQSDSRNWSITARAFPCRVEARIYVMITCRVDSR